MDNPVEPNKEEAKETTHEAPAEETKLEEVKEGDKDLSTATEGPSSTEESSSKEVQEPTSTPVAEATSTTTTETSAAPPAEEEKKPDSSSGRALCENECSNTADVECPQCDAKYCNSCFEAVHKPPAMRKHTKTPIGHKQSRQCPEHKKDLEMFCNTCGELVCLMCMYGKHNGHAGVLAKQKTQESLDTLKKSIEQVKEHNAKIKDHIQQVETSLGQIEQEKDDGKEQINLICDAVIERVNSQRERLLRETESIADPHEKVLRSRKDDLHAILRLLNENMENYKKILESSEADEQIAKTIQLDKDVATSVQKAGSVEPGKTQNQLIRIQPGQGEYGLPQVIDIEAELQQQEKEKEKEQEKGKPQTKKPAVKIGGTKGKAGVEELEQKLARIKQGIVDQGVHTVAPSEQGDPSKVTPPSSRPGATASKNPPASGGFQGLQLGAKKQQTDYISTILTTQQSRGVKFNDKGELFVCIYNSDKVLIYDSSDKEVGSVEASNPYGLSIDKKGFIYVSDYVNGVVRKIQRSSGKETKVIGSYGEGQEQLLSPRGIALDKWDNLFVTDEESGRVQMYDVSGKWVRSVGSKGSGTDQLVRPHDVAVDSDKLFVADRDNNRIQVYNASTGKHLYQIGGPGYGRGQFEGPESVYVDKKGRLIVGDYGGKKRVQWVTKDKGEWVAELDDPTTKMNWVCSIAENEKGEIYFSDVKNARVVKFKVNV